MYIHSVYSQQALLKEAIITESFNQQSLKELVRLEEEKKKVKIKIIIKISFFIIFIFLYIYNFIYFLIF